MAQVRTRPLCGLAEREQAVRLYRRTFALADTDPAMTPKLLAALQHNGGSAVGAFDPARELVGFAYGFVGIDAEGQIFHYSQAACVAEGQQGRGIGRVLKFAQAEAALSHGLTRMRWAYDPLQARNAHFNLDVLGARGHWFHRDYYDLSDAQGRSDRVVVEWNLECVRDRTAGAAVEPAHPVTAAEAGPLSWGESRRLGTDVVLVIPADWTGLADRDPAEASRLRDLVADRLAALLPDGCCLTSCRRLDENRAAYRLSRCEVACGHHHC